MALAAGLLSSNAQVYSANVVGYYNIVTPLGTPGHSKRHLLGNQLLGPGNTNDIDVVLVAGLDDSTDQGVNLLTWNYATKQFVTSTYFGPSNAGNSTGVWADSLGNPVVISLNQLDGAFLENFSGRAITNTVVGTVVQGPLSKTIGTGLNPYSLPVPVSTNLLAGSLSLVTTDAYDQKVNYVHYNVAAQQFDGALTYFGPSNAGNATGAWADSLGNDQTANPAYFPTVGEGFFIDNYSGNTFPWTPSFTVQ